MVPGYRILQLDEQYAGKHIRVICLPLPAGPPGGSEGLLFPGERRVRLKDLISLPGGRISLSLKGARRAEAVRGAVLLDTEWPVAQHREALLLSDGRPLPKGPCPLSGGIFPGFNAEGLIGRACFRREGSFFRVQLPRPYPMLPGTRMSVPGAEGEVRRLTLFYPGLANPALLRRFNAGARRRPGPHPDMSEIYGRLLYGVGFQRVPPILGDYQFPDSTKVGNWTILNDRLRAMEKSLVKLASKPGGVDADGLRLDAYPHELLICAAEALCERNELIRRSGWYFPPGDPPLSPFHRSWLERVRGAGEEGFRIREAGASSDVEALKALGRSALILGGEVLWFAPEAVEAMSQCLLADMRPGEMLLMGDVRAKISGSRAVCLELLKILEFIGRLKVREDGVTRVVL